MRTILRGGDGLGMEGGVTTRSIYRYNSVNLKLYVVSKKYNYMEIRYTFLYMIVQEECR